MRVESWAALYNLIAGIEQSKKQAAVSLQPFPSSTGTASLAVRRFALDGFTYSRGYLTNKN